MVQRLRGHVRQQFVGYLALFVAMGGTAAGAGYVVSRNAQIAPNTISGSAPPRGKHSNIIAGSLGARDLGRNAVLGSRLADGAVTGPKIAPGTIDGSRVAGDTLTGSHINEGTLDPVPVARRAWDADRIEGREPPKSFGITVPDGTSPRGLTYTMGRVQVELGCNVSGKVTIRFREYANTPGTLNWLYGNGSQFFANGLVLPQGSFLSDPFAISEPRIEGQFIYRSADNEVTTVVLHALRVGSNGICEAQGTIMWPADGTFPG